MLVAKVANVSNGEGKVLFSYGVGKSSLVV